MTSTVEVPLETREGDSPPLGRLLLVIWPAYGIMAFCVFAGWKLRSVPAITTGAALAAGVSVVLGGVGFLRARTAWCDFEARTSRTLSRKSLAKTQRRRANVPEVDNGESERQPIGIGVSTVPSVRVNAPRAEEACRLQDAGIDE